MNAVPPIFALLTALVLGVLAAPYLSWLLLLAALLTGPVIFLAARRRLRGSAASSATALLWYLPFVFAGALQARQAATPMPDDVSRYAGGPSLRVRGVIASAVLHGGGETWTFTLAVSAVDDYRAVHPASGRLRVTLLGAGKPPAYGDEVWIRGRVALPPIATNPGAFDYRAYLTRRGVFSTLVVKRPADMALTGRSASSPAGRVAVLLRGAVQRATAAHLPPEDAALLNGLLLSIRGDLSGEISDAFARTGTVHVLSTSGMHLGLLALSLGGLFRRISAPRKAANVAAIALIWVYALASGAGPAAVRAALMLTVTLAAPLVKREADPLVALAVAACVILIASPLALYDPGTQLSFVIMAALLLYLPPLERVFFPREGGGQALRERMSRDGAALLAASVIAHLGSAPLVAYHFNVFSVVAPVANLPIALLTGYLLIGGLLAVAMTVASPLTAFLALPIWGGLGIGLWALRWLALSFAAPVWAVVSVPSPHAAGLLLYYLILGGGGLLVRRYALRKTFFAPPVPAAVPADPGGPLVGMAPSVAP